ncbi:MAG: hypothetical protein R3239_00975, partial [Thermodesulfobacteriota bacterium]|nr:hypothetical protein [Thermodesulfobacteriota bacterium]
AIRELILAVAESVSDRLITSFFDRYSTGRMALTKPVSFLVWKLMPEEERIRLLRLDNEPMDQAMMARHLARFIQSASPSDLGDAGRQIALLPDGKFQSNAGSILKNLGGEGTGDGVRRLYDEVTVMALRMMSFGYEGRQWAFEAIRRKIAETAGIPLETTEGEE